MHQPIVRSGRARMITFLCLLALTPLSSSDAQAFEGAASIYPKGFAAFMSGFIAPEPGHFIVNPYYYAFDGSANASVRNGRVELGVDSVTDGVFVQAFYTTAWRFFGGTYSIGGEVGYSWAGTTATVDTPQGSVTVSQSENGISDSLFIPINLSGHTGNWHMNAGLSFYLPTSPYNIGSLSAGRNLWAVTPTFAVTWFDMANGWDVSGAFALVIPGENEATDYQSGVVAQLDWAIGKQFGEWEIGIAGNIVKQITGDSGSGARLGGFRMESFGIGPAINYTTMIGTTPMTLSAQWQPDISATNTLKGDVITASLAFVF